MPSPKPQGGEVELDLGRYELRRSGRAVKLEKKPMELLIFLVARREQLVTRKDIVTKLWRSDLFVDTEANINNVIRKIRTALGDSSAKPRFLQTVVGKGYRFVGPVRVIDASLSQFDKSSATDTKGGQIPLLDERATLAVLPLCLLGNIPDDKGVCLGFADALVSRLGNLKDVDVLPTSSMLSVPAEMSASDVGSRLGVRFVVHGAIRESKGQWRLALQMFDTHLQGAGFTWKRDLDLDRLVELEDEIAKQIASALNRPLRPQTARSQRYSKDHVAYAEYMRGYRLSSSGDHALLEEAVERLSNAVTRDPSFALAHATLSLACATRYLEVDPASKWSEKAEFHCAKALELSRDLPEAHVAKAFLLWSPLKNFQHLDAIVELRKAIALQKNLPRAYNRLGTILAHIGLLDRAREMYERGRPFQPKKVLNHSIVQVYLWNLELDLAAQEIRAWRDESLSNKYVGYFAAQQALMAGAWDDAKVLLDESIQAFPEEPLVVSLLGTWWALMGNAERATDCITRACSSAKSFGHAHHTYYQIACIFSLLDRPDVAFEWLERSVNHGFACWPFFQKDVCLQNLRSLPEFDRLVSSLQAKYPDHLGLL
ncbi:MAG TPA: winged helix-turn-helix domain-containing protein [Candidatus Sulfotelmatobacter sp.]|nr:winged helix-turn-helix domain-containing protein [Candidatus Sulfotelmatobacter sp.]